MENNKNYNARPNGKASQTDCGRKSTDLQSNKPWPKNSRHRENPSSTPRNGNESYRNSKQNSSKNRGNYDKRPRPRGGGGGSGSYSSGSGGSNASDGSATLGRGGEGADGFNFESACAFDDVSAAGAGLAAKTVAAGAANGAVAKKVPISNENYSVYACGSKKQNLNHLLNFHYHSRDYTGAAHNVFGQRQHNQHHSHAAGGAAAAANGKKHHRYNKEQFLQANFQFVIKSSAKPRLTASPDTLIDWDLIEQINIQTTEEPRCPICLYPPIAAKLTRCGHAYCWPCILHYLAVSEKTWRKCPICYEAVHTGDLKSTAIVQQRAIGTGDQITFNLMRRRKDSMFVEKYIDANTTSIERFPEFSNNREAKLFSKFVIARRADILEIIEREHKELTQDEDASCPEFVFIQQALDLLQERRAALGTVRATIVEDAAGEEEGGTSGIQDDVMSVVSHDDDNAEQASTEEAAPPPSPTSPSSPMSPAASSKSSAKKFYYFYQSEDGQNIFLHPLNVKMLQACYGTLDNGPTTLTARILQKEHLQMNEEHRRKFTCLAHLPLTCEFAVVEIDLQPPIVTDAILRLFKDDLLFRKKERQRRDREERKREKQIDEINDRQMGKLIASAVNLNLSSALEFPTCGFEEPLPGTTETPTSHVAARTSKPIAMQQQQQQSTMYSTIAVTGGSPKKEFWPTLSSPNAATQSTVAWGRHAGNNNNNTHAIAASNAQRAAVERHFDVLDGDDAVDYGLCGPKVHNLSDVLAEAISQQKQKDNNHKMSAGATNGNNNGAGGGGGGKKGKRGKKMTPVFSTGMNFGSGN